MQLVALNNDKRVIAGQAFKKTEYRCLECLNPVRLRSGPHRQPHFYHLTSHPLCRQQGKTLCHLHTQSYLLKTLPPGEAELEVAFPQIGRIADVVWEAKLLIFEVQCSPISVQEVKERIHDYESLGYRVIWILHQKRFNRYLLSAAEQFLLAKECYFTSINEKGSGVIYDQFSVIHNGKRFFRGPALKISLISPFHLQDFSLSEHAPTTLIFRQKTRRLGFRDDLFDRMQKADPKDWISVKYLEQRFDEKNTYLKKTKRGLRWLKNVYLSFLHALLEKHSV